MFSGTTFHSVDAKGRIVLPAKFREELGESFYIARGFKNPCIQALSTEQFNKFSAKIMEMPANKAMALQYYFTATAVEVTPNSSGRIMLPQSLREMAKIEDEVVVLGMINRIEIWNKKEYDAFMLTQAESLSEAMDELILL